jgi:prepilin-type N-terminal cleavage/methylation domain-containing protein
MGSETTPHRRLEPSARQAGFTLAEVLVAAAVLLIVLVPMSLALVTQSGLLTTNQAEVTAAHLAAGQLESDRTVADANVWSGSPAPVPTLPAITSPVTVAASSSGGATISYTVTRSSGWCMLPATGTTWTTTAGASTIPGTAAVGYKDLVTVTWNGGKLQSAQVLQIPFGSIGAPPTQAQSCPS